MKRDEEEKMYAKKNISRRRKVSAKDQIIYIIAMIAKNSPTPFSLCYYFVCFSADVSKKLNSQ